MSISLACKAVLPLILQTDTQWAKSHLGFFCNYDPMAEKLQGNSDGDV